MTYSKTVKSLFFLVLCTLFTQISFAQNVDDIIAKHVKAMGGAQKLTNFKSVRIMATASVMNMEMPVTTIIVQDQAFRAETTVQGQKVIQVVNGKSGWMTNPMIQGENKTMALPEETAQTLLNQTDLTGLFNYKGKGHTITLDGEEDLEGAKVYKVGVVFKNGVKQVNYISKDTFYILKVTSEATVSNQVVKSESLQSNFKQIDGITFPFNVKVTTSAMPNMVMDTKVESIEVNPKIDNIIFEMPK